MHALPRKRHRPSGPQRGRSAGPRTRRESRPAGQPARPALQNVGARRRVVRCPGRPSAGRARRGSWWRKGCRYAPCVVRGEPAVGQCLAEQPGCAFAVGVRRTQPQLAPVVSWHGTHRNGRPSAGPATTYRLHDQANQEQVSQRRWGRNRPGRCPILGARWGAAHLPEMRLGTVSGTACIAPDQ